MNDPKLEHLYKKAHKAVLDILPELKGESLSREQWWKILHINLNGEDHRPFRNAVNTVLWNLSSANTKKLVVKDGSRFKVVDDALVEINFRQANLSSKVDLILPFGIHQYCCLYRKNIMIVSGSKDAGKTAMLLNIARWNMNKHRIVYWSSEMVDEEFRQRLLAYKDLSLEDWNIEAYERSYNFDEVIVPDAINLIDFLELGGDEMEYYRVVSLIRKIYDKLDKGVAIIALQKNNKAVLPKGGSGALEKARIALMLDRNKATLAVAKNWQPGITQNPRGKAWTFKLVGGINIVNTHEVTATNDD